MSTLGFVVLSHSQPDRLLRLVSTIQKLYKPCAVVCHHDFTKCAVDPAVFPTGVHFVKPHVCTYWGDISIVLALFISIRCLYELSDPDWFTILSESDYPIKRSENLLEELSNTRYDAFLDHREIKYNPNAKDILRRIESGTHVCKHGQGPEWEVIAYERYVSVEFPVPSLFKRRRRTVTLRHPYLVWPFHCFNSRSRCFAGDLWFTGNRRTARVILASADIRLPLIQQFRGCPVPDEAMFQTILCNRTDLRICTDNGRFADWSMGGNHPKTLTLEDLPRVLASGAHFARKFADDAVLNAVDTALGIGA